MTKLFNAALEATSPQFRARADVTPFPETYDFPISTHDLPAIKEVLRVALPDIKPSHRLEILARMAGHSTAAALQSELRTAPFCTSLAPFLSDPNHAFIENILTTTVGTSVVDPRSWVMTHHLHNIVISWVARSRFGRAHPQTDDALLQDAEDFSGNTEGAMLFEHILETRKLDALIALPGKTMTNALRNIDGKDVEQSLREITHAFAFGVAVDATTYQGDFEMCDIERAADDGEIVYEGDPDDETSLISTPTKTIAQMIEMAGEEHPDLVYDHLGYNTLRDHSALDARCFALAAQDGLPASLWALSTASLLLAVDMGSMPINVASRRLFGTDEHSIVDLIPGRDWSRAHADWRRNIPNVTAFTGLTAAETEATYADLMDEWWEERPLLDFWLEMLDGISQGLHLPQESQGEL